jgi:hypothetical protein
MVSAHIFDIALHASCGATVCAAIGAITKTTTKTG